MHDRSSGEADREKRAADRLQTGDHRTKLIKRTWATENDTTFSYDQM